MQTDTAIIVITGIDTIVGFNGVYDIACCISILMFPHSLLSTLHISIFSTDLGEIGKELWHRILAYWIFTYGTVRLCAAVYRSPVLDGLCAMSYLIEGISYGMEKRYYMSTLQNAGFVSSSSLCLFIILLLRTCLYIP